MINKSFYDMELKQQKNMIRKFFRKKTYQKKKNKRKIIENKKIKKH